MNEILILPHFINHYRSVGIKSFIFIDNCSDDGTREYLLEQNDVVLFSADTEYKLSHYGVNWQQAILSNFCINKWVVLADADEFICYPDFETDCIEDFISELEVNDFNCIRVNMIDMYPMGKLIDANLKKNDPLEICCWYDKNPLNEDRLGSGSFSNTQSVVSSLRHRLSPNSPHSSYVSQKFSLVKYSPFMRFSEGIHYASNVKVPENSIAYMHFKYHSEFISKVKREVERKQHFENATEYKKYLELLNENVDIFWSKKKSIKFVDSKQFLSSIN